jgi:hypothetical protein
MNRRIVYLDLHVDAALLLASTHCVSKFGWIVIISSLTADARAVSDVV